MRHPHTDEVIEINAPDTDAISRAAVAGFGQVPAPKPKAIAVARVPEAN